MYTFILCVIIIAALWFFQGHIGQRSDIRRNGIRLSPPPGTIALAGNGLWFLKPKHMMLDWFAQCERVMGIQTVELFIPTMPPTILIADPQNIEHVLKNNEVFVKGEFFRTRSWDLFGNGIINADGELWKTQRKAGLRFFSNANLKRFINEALPPLLLDTQQTLANAATDDDQIDLQDILLELTTRLMGRVAYGMDMPGSLPFSKAFDFASGVTAQRFQNPFYKLKEYFVGAPLRKAVLEVKTFGRKIVSAAILKRGDEESLRGPSKTESTDPLTNNLINSLLDHLEDQQIVADAAMNYLSAGRDTTAQSLTWTLYLLMRHPAARRKILEELRTAFPNAGQHLPVSFDTVQPSSLPYTMAVFNESLRLYPPVPIEIKECTANSIFPDGTSLPKGSVVMWVPWAMGRSRSIWGQDADEFRPERWLQSDDRSKQLEHTVTCDVEKRQKPAQLVSKSAFEFPVFNGGPRSCLGKRLAELLAVYVVATLVWSYDFEEIVDKKLGGCGAGNARLSQDSLTLPMEGGLPCLVRSRKSWTQEEDNTRTRVAPIQGR